MHVSLQPPPLPLTEREDGVIRIGGTRVTLDTLVYAFREGCSPEAIAEQYRGFAQRYLRRDQFLS